MRLVQILVPEGRLAAVTAALDEENVDYALSPEGSRGVYEAILYIPLPENAVGPVLERLSQAGIAEPACTIVLPAETVVSKRAEGLASRYKGFNIAPAELVARAREMAPAWSTFAILTVVSAAVATTGLIHDSAAVIIGAMVIAPLMGPAVAASVGLVLDDARLSRRGAALQMGGIVLAVATAAALTFAMRAAFLIPVGADLPAVPEIRARIVPDVLALGIAVGAGVAAVVSLVRGVGGVVVGAMIAVALVPPASTVGIMLVTGYPLAAFGAAVMVLTNVLSVNLAALAILWWAGYARPAEPTRAHVRRRMRRRVAALVGSLAALAVVLAGVSYVSYLSAALANDAKAETEALVREPEFSGFELVKVETNARPLDAHLFDEEPRVIVTVDAPRGGDVEKFVDRLSGTIETPLGKDAAIEVRVIETVRAG